MRYKRRASSPSIIWQYWHRWLCACGQHAGLRELGDDVEEGLVVRGADAGDGVPALERGEALRPALSQHRRRREGMVVLDEVRSPEKSGGAPSPP
jgi:hypothetical protein